MLSEYLMNEWMCECSGISNSNLPRTFRDERCVLGPVEHTVGSMDQKTAAATIQKTVSAASFRMQGPWWRQESPAAFLGWLSLPGSGWAL